MLPLPQTVQDFHSSQNLKQMLRSAVETQSILLKEVTSPCPWKELSPSELCFWAGRRGLDGHRGCGRGRRCG